MAYKAPRSLEESGRVTQRPLITRTCVKIRPCEYFWEVLFAINIHTGTLKYSIIHQM